jgi:hypothetical protein
MGEVVRVKTGLFEQICAEHYRWMHEHVPKVHTPQDRGMAGRCLIPIPGSTIQIFKKTPGSQEACVGMPLQIIDLPVKPVGVASIVAIEPGNKGRVGIVEDPLKSGVQGLCDPSVCMQADEV